jgi:hypothetical protein
MKTINFKENSVSPEKIRETAFNNQVRKLVIIANSEGVSKLKYQREFLLNNPTLSQQKKSLSNKELVDAYDLAIQVYLENLKSPKKVRKTKKQTV